MRTETETKAELRASRDAWKKLAEEGLEPRIRELRLAGADMNVQITGKAVEHISVAFVSYFKSLGAENYVEMNIHDRDEPFARYTVTVQKVGALSPADKVKAAEKRAVELEELLKNTAPKSPETQAETTD